MPRFRPPAAGRLAHRRTVAAAVLTLALASPAVTLPIAQWITVRDGRIAALRVFFDPRPLVQPAS